MVEDHGVDGEAGLARRQTVVTELGRQHRLQIRDVRDLVDLPVAERDVGVDENDENNDIVGSSNLGVCRNLPDLILIIGN